MSSSSSHTVYCVDASACALLSEDFPGTTRLHFQRELVACHSGAPARCPPAELALVAGAGGRASVVLHPSAEPGALRAALDGLQAAGEANLEAALKLALLVSRRFPAGATHVTAFVASAASPASLAGDADFSAATELRQRYAEAGLSLDVAVLCPRSELRPAAVQALEALTCTDRGGSSSQPSSDEQAGADEANTAPASPASGSSGGSANRLLWLTPVDSAAESWQQLEPALEQLERRRAAASPQADRSRGGAGVSALPRRISRGPRQLDGLRQPRASLLAARSGVQQPALCRGESLNRLGHLSSDGMARAWLPTYSSLGQQAGVRAAAASGGGLPGPAASAGMVYVEVQPIPRWRTLLKVAAGRMLPQAPAGASGSSSPTAGYASASSQLLASLEALSVLDEEEDEDGSGGSARTAAPSAPVRYTPDSARGVLRLLQGTKEPRLLKLVWSPDRPAPATAAADADGQRRQQQQPLDMFGDPSSASGGSGTSTQRAELLTYMPASAVAASAARGPIIRDGCELWETAAEWEWELLLPTPEAVPSEHPAACSPSSSSSSSSSSDGSEVEAPVLPASVEARELPNGAQVLVVTPTRSPGQRRRQVKAAAAFWLQQRLQPDSLALPTYCSAAPAAGTSQEQPEAVEGGAARLAAALLSHLRAPPAVDVRQLRKDVKEGVLQVTPITVGPLPASLVRDLLGSRSRLMAGMGVDNLDSWDEGAGSSSASASGASTTGGGSGAATKATSGIGSSGADGKAGGGSTAGAGMSPEEAAAVMQQNQSAVMSLLRQRLLNRSGSGKRASSSGASASSSTGQEPAPADGMPATTPAEQTPEPSGAIPCTPQQPMGGDGFGGSFSSTGGTPFGTPLHILPSSLLHRSGGTADGAADPDASSAAAEAAGSGQADGAGAQLLPVGAKPPEGGDGDHLFQLE